VIATSHGEGGAGLEYPSGSVTPPAKTTASEVLAAAHSFGIQLHVLNASSESDFDGVFAKLAKLKAGGLVVAGGPFFVSHREQLAALTVRNAVPVAFQHREFAAAGGLLSYGSDITDAYRLTGIYTGRILKGDKPADLPVQAGSMATGLGWGDGSYLLFVEPRLIGNLDVVSVRVADVCRKVVGTPFGPKARFLV
jgi:hypothetical protein